MNLGVGAYRDDNEKPFVFKVVKEAELELAKMTQENKIDKEYLPIDGLAQFNTESQKLIFGKDAAVMKESRVVTLQSLSGTGSLRVAFEFLRRHAPANVYVSNPTWGNHNAIVKDSGLPVLSYPYYKASTRGLDFPAMKACLSNANPGSIVLLHACAHNPTGVDLSLDQWAELAEVFLARGLLPLFDSAYQGYASGDLEKDIQSVRLFVQKGIQVVVTQSYAKNFGLYGERIGAIHITCPSSDNAKIVMSQIKLVARAMYSSPPVHGARLVAMCLSKPEFKAQWEAELKMVAGRILEMRSLLRKHLEELGVSGTWKHITEQIGMFSYTGMTAKQCSVLIDKYSIYLLKNGRISMAGITTKNVKYLAEAMKDAVNNH